MPLFDFAGNHAADFDYFSIFKEIRNFAKIKNPVNPVKNYFKIKILCEKYLFQNLL